MRVKATFTFTSLFFLASVVFNTFSFADQIKEPDSSSLQLKDILAFDPDWNPATTGPFETLDSDGFVLQVSMGPVRKIKFPLHLNAQSPIRLETSHGPIWQYLNSKKSYTALISGNYLVYQSENDAIVYRWNETGKALKEYIYVPFREALSQNGQVLSWYFKGITLTPGNDGSVSLVRTYNPKRELDRITDPGMADRVQKYIRKVNRGPLSEHGMRRTLLNIPPPDYLDANQVNHETGVSFEVERNRLTLNLTDWQDLNFPLWVDPTLTSELNSQIEFTQETIDTDDDDQTIFTQDMRVGFLGDVNGDGLEDVMVCATINDSLNGVSAELSVFFGRVFNQTLQLQSGMDNGEADLYFQSDTGFDFCQTASRIGDFNADGYSDILVGGVLGSVAKPNVLLILFGRESFEKTVFDPLVDFDIRIEGTRSLNPVSFLGDFNGDGFDDVLAWSFQDALIYFGSEPDEPLVLDATDDVNFTLPKLYLFTDSTARGAGDINGDGFADVVTGHPSISSATDLFTGGVHIYFGREVTDDPETQSSIEPDIFIFGDHRNDFMGDVMVPVGDFNGDGKDDLLLGVKGIDGEGLVDSGGAFVYLGREAEEPLFLRSFDAGLTIEGTESLEGFGYKAFSSGDFNSDNLPDILVWGKKEQARGSLYFGREFESPLVLKSESDADYLLDISSPFMFFHQGIFDLAGDFNGNGFSEIIAPGVHDFTDEQGNHFVDTGFLFSFNDIIINSILPKELVWANSLGTLEVSVDAESIRDHELSYLWESECEGGLEDGEFEHPSLPLTHWSAPEHTSGEDQLCVLTVTIDNETSDPVSTRSINVFVSPVSTHDHILLSPIETANTQVASGEVVPLTAVAQELLGHDLNILWKAICPSNFGEGEFSNLNATETEWTAPINTAKRERTCRLTLTADDGLPGPKARKIIDIIVEAVPVPEHQLIIHKLTPNKSSLASEDIVPVSVTAEDTLGHNLLYSWSSDCEGLPENGSFADPTMASTTWNTPPNLTTEKQLCLLTVDIEDSSGELNAQGSLEFDVRTGIEHTLEIASLKPGDVEVAPGDRVLVSVKADDSHNNKLKYLWESDCGESLDNGEFASIDSKNTHWDVPSNFTEENQNCTLTILVETDPESLNVESKMVFTILPQDSESKGGGRDRGNSSHKVQIQNVLPKNAKMNAGEVLSVSVKAKDSSDHPLNYTWESVCPDQIVHGQFNDSLSPAPLWTAPQEIDEPTVCSLAVIVDDGEFGLSEMDSVQVEVQPLTPEQKLILELLMAENLDIESGESVELLARTIHSAGMELNITWQSECFGGEDHGQFKNRKSIETFWTAPKNKGKKSARCSLTLSVEDQTGEFNASKSIDVSIRPQGFEIFPTEGPSSLMVVSPYWQADSGVYTFIGVSHPSLSAMNSQIGVRLQALTQSNELVDAPLEFTIDSGVTQKIFIVQTNNPFINQENLPASLFQFAGPDSSERGQLKFTPIASNPLNLMGDPGAEGRGYADITMLGFWGAVVVRANSTGFAMEFIGDMKDSRASGRTTASGVN